MHNISHHALIVVADGKGARFFRNSRSERKVSLSADIREVGKTLTKASVADIERALD